MLLQELEFGTSLTLTILGMSKKASQYVVDLLIAVRKISRSFKYFLQKMRPLIFGAQIGTQRRALSHGRTVRGGGRALKMS
jgi:hypothetical protein